MYRPVSPLGVLAAAALWLLCSGPVAAEPVQLDLPMHQDEEMPRRIALMMQRGALQQAAAAGAERQFLQRRLG